VRCSAPVFSKLSFSSVSPYSCPIVLLLFYLRAFYDSLVGFAPFIGERELRQFAVKVTGQFTNYRFVNSRANEDYRRSERRRDTEGCQGRTPGMIITTITTTTAAAMTTMMMLLRCSPGEHRRTRMSGLSSLPLKNNIFIAVAPENRVALCNANRA